MARPSSPIVDRRALASALRSMRDAAGFSLDEAATQALDASAAKLSRIETGKQIAGPRDVRDLCRLYAASDARTRALVALAHTARERGWWEEFDLELDDYIGLESAAVEIQQFEATAVPGLLQTQQYASAYLKNAIAPVRAQPWTETRRARFLEVLHLRQQHVLPPESGARLSFVLDEAVFLRTDSHVGMREQVDHIRTVAMQPNVEIRVLPLQLGTSPAQQGGFTNLTLRDGSRYTYLETVGGNLLLDSEDHTERLQDVFGHLQSRSEPEARTDDVLSRIAGEHS